MFDIGFWEILLIVILALLVIGPERLPGAARKAGYWIGRGRRFVEGVRSDVESQVDLGEFKRLLHNQEVQINELQEKLKSGVSEVESAASNIENQILTDVPSHKFDADDASQYEMIEEAVTADGAGSKATSSSDGDGDATDSNSNESKKKGESHPGSSS